MIYFLVQILFFGTVLGRFSRYIFEKFSSFANHGGQHFYSALTRKKLSSALYKVKYIVF